MRSPATQAASGRSSAGASSLAFVRGLHMTTTLITPAPAPAASPRRPKRASQGPVGGRGGGDAWKLVLPCLLPVMLFSVYPLLRGIYLGFTDAEAGLNATTTFTGLENYRNLLRQRPVLGLVPHRADLDGLGDRPAVLPLPRPRAAAQPRPQAALARPDPRPRAVGDAAGDRGDHVAADAPPALRGREQGAPRARVRRTTPTGSATSSTPCPAAILVGVWSGMPQTTITLLAGLQIGARGAPRGRRRSTAPGRVRRFFHVTLPALRPIIVAITTLDLITTSTRSPSSTC